METDLFVCKTKPLHHLEFDKFIQIEHQGRLVGMGMYEVAFSSFGKSKFKHEVCEMNFGGDLVMMVLQENPHEYALKLPRKKTTFRVVRNSFFPFRGHYQLESDMRIVFRTKMDFKKLCARTMYQIHDRVVCEVREFICEEGNEGADFILYSENFKNSGFPDLHAFLTLCIRETLWGVPDVWP